MVESSCADAKIIGALKIMYIKLFENDLLCIPEKSSDEASVLQFVLVQVHPIHSICAGLDSVVCVEAIGAKKLNSVSLVLAESYGL